MTLSKSLCVATTIACIGANGALAQTTPSAPAGRFIDVGSERERVLRVLQITGDVPLYPWSMRGLSPSESDRLRPTSAPRLTHSGILPRDSSAHVVGPLRVEVLPVQTQIIYNSAFPYGYNDGPIWAGRGVTGALSAGVAGRVGPLSFQLEPMVFDAQNASFPLAPTIIPSNPYGDPFHAEAIDLPQRFGNRAYHRVDPGQSSVRLDVGLIAAELSTANQWWGPTLEQPLLVGDNAPGFLHAMLGTAHPVNIGVGSVHGRLVWGRLRQSEFSNEHSADSLRFMSGFVASFTPHGVPGLELGASRFFHTRWPAGGLRDAPFLRSLQGFLKGKLSTIGNGAAEDTGDNQLASVFFRWVFPSSGFEVYGEAGREDHSADLRDFYSEPDHDAGYTAGFQRAWTRGRGVFVVRAEILDTRLSPLYQGRQQAPWYIHAPNLQTGHTVEGQILGAPGAYGGGGSLVGTDMLTDDGRWTVQWTRMLRAESHGSDGSPTQNGTDVMHALGVERMVTKGRVSISGGLRGVWDLNRNFAGDRFNLNASLGVQRSW